VRPTQLTSTHMTLC